MKQSLASQVYKLEVDGHKLHGETETQYKQRFATAETAMCEMANQLATVKDADVASALLPSAAQSPGNVHLHRLALPTDIEPSFEQGPPQMLC